MKVRNAGQGSTLFDIGAVRGGEADASRAEPSFEAFLERSSQAVKTRDERAPEQSPIKRETVRQEQDAREPERVTSGSERVPAAEEPAGREEPSESRESLGAGAVERPVRETIVRAEPGDEAYPMEEGATDVEETGLVDVLTGGALLASLLTPLRPAPKVQPEQCAAGGKPGAAPSAGLPLNTQVGASLSLIGTGDDVVQVLPSIGAQSSAFARLIRDAAGVKASTPAEHGVGSLTAEVGKQAESREAERENVAPIDLATALPAREDTLDLEIPAPNWRLAREAGRSASGREQGEPIRNENVDESTRTPDAQAQDMQSGSPVTSGGGLERRYSAAEPQAFRGTTTLESGAARREHVTGEDEAAVSATGDSAGEPLMDGVVDSTFQGNAHGEGRPQDRQSEQGPGSRPGTEAAAVRGAEAGSRSSAEVAETPAEAVDLAGRLRSAVTDALSGVDAKEQRAVVELQDPELGRMRLEVSVEGGKLKLDVWVEQDAARRLLQDSKQALQDELARHQLQLEQFQVGGGAGGQAGDPRQRSAEAAQRREIDGRVSRRGPVSTPPAPRVSMHDGQIDTIA